MYGNINIIASKLKSIKETYNDSPKIYVNSDYEFEINTRIKELEMVVSDIDKFTAELKVFENQQQAYMVDNDIDSALEVQYDISKIKKKLSELKGRKYQIILKYRDYRYAALDIQDILYEVNHR